METIVARPANRRISADYDADSDVLYVSMGPPVPSESETDPSGVLLRWSIESGAASSATIVGFRRYGWPERLPQLMAVVRSHFHAPEIETRAAIEGAVATAVLG